MAEAPTLEPALCCWALDQAKARACPAQGKQPNVGAKHRIVCTGLISLQLAVSKMKNGERKGGCHVLGMVVAFLR